MRLEAAYNEDVINPSLGIELGGYGFYRNRRNKGVHDDLHVRTLLLETEGKSVLIYNADLLEVSEYVVSEVKRKVSKKLGIHESNIILTVTHTHSAPPTTRFRGLGEVSKEYVDFLIEKFVSSAEGIKEKSTEVRPFFSKSTLKGVSFNRVVKGGPVDSFVRVIQLKDSLNKPFVTMFNYSCHPVTVDVRTEYGFYVSADWPGVSMRVINKETGGFSVFLQGTCGDIDPVIAWKMRGFDACEEVGLKVGKSVFEAIDRLKEIKNYELEVRSKRISLPLQQITHEDLIKIISVHLKRVESLKPDIIMDVSNVLALIRFYRESMEELCERISKGLLPENIKRDIYLIKLGRASVLFVPGEVFVEIGLKIRERLQLDDLLIVGYTGAYAGYIPTPKEFDRYGYAAYMVPLMLGYPPYKKDIARVLIDECVKLLEIE